jgi:uncharacterized phage protein (TIGR01671 family)
MNRQIKFRAWDTKNKKWLKEVPTLEYLLDDPNETVSHHDIDEEAALYFYPQDPLGETFNGRVIYQQFTGLKDKNGVEIYEGDILGNKSGQALDYRFVVSFELTTHSEHGHGDSGTGYSVGFYFDGYLGNPQERDILGNIFENSELLNF